MKHKLGAPLDQVPTLLIDDESDQASINVFRGPNKEEKTATNRAITDLLKLLPRGQYIGYTATPFANVFVDPNNEEDIFPKDFLISLPRPNSYMGVSDFYDLNGSKEIPGSQPNKRDYVREVSGPDKADDNLPKAIDAFVLSGAIKLFRERADLGIGFKHHTMLAHSSAHVADHQALAHSICRIYARAAYDGGAGLEQLRRLFEDDFRPVSLEREPALPFPGGFEDVVNQ